MMRRVMIPVLLLSFGLAVGSDAVAQVGLDKGFYLRGQLGYAWPSLNAVNDEIRAEEESFRPFTTLLDWAEMEGGWRYSGEVGYSMTPAFSLGLEFGYQKSVREHDATVLFDTGSAIVSGTLSEKVDASLFTVMLTPTFRVHSTPGLHLGAQVGIGRGAFDRRESDNLGATDGTFLVGTFVEEYDQTAFAGGLFAGVDFPVSPAVAFSLRAGYLISSFSGMDGTGSANGSTETGPFSGSGPIELTDSAGNPLEVSFNGLNLNAGFVLRLGSGR